MLHSKDIFKDVLLGVVVGDALGVPVEFKTREALKLNPITDMIGYGTYNLPAGTWSDDSSLTLCLAEALLEPFDLNVIANSFVKWLYHNHWTPLGKVFDVGFTTKDSIDRVKLGVSPEFAGGIDEDENGNGSLMRILPLLFYINNKEANQRFYAIKQVSSITHGHIRSVISCYYYLEFARELLIIKDKRKAYNNTRSRIKVRLQQHNINLKEINTLYRLLEGDISNLDEKSIYSTGYVIHTLEASIWCILTTNNYKEAVLKAVNLGGDTDTTGAVTGGLAGILYGHDTIPLEWLNKVARLDDIYNLALHLKNKYYYSGNIFKK